MSKASSIAMSILYRIGTYVEGVATFTGAAGSGAPLQCLIKNYNNPREVVVLDASALCDANEVNIPGRGSGTVTFDAMVPLGGRIFKGKQGLPIEFVVKEAASVTVGETLVGFISSVNHTAPNGDLQMEAVSVRLSTPTEED